MPYLTMHFSVFISLLAYIRVVMIKIIDVKPVSRVPGISHMLSKWELLIVVTSSGLIIVPMNYIAFFCSTNEEINTYRGWFP